MTNVTEILIASLADSMETTKPVASPLRLFGKWVGVSLLYAALLLCFFGLRPDLSAKFHSAGFVAEIALLAAIVISCGISAMVLSFPDLHQKPWLVVTPILPLLLFTELMITGLAHENPAIPKPPHGIECLICICIYSLPPAIWAIFMLRKQASTHPYLTGGVAMLAASGIGCLAIRLTEATDSLSHLVEWHYLPMIGVALLGVGLGKTFLKW